MTFWLRTEEIGASVVNVLPDQIALAEAAAKIFMVEAENAILRSGRFNVALSGGHTPIATFRLLASERYAKKIQWKHCHIFWGDERAVPESDPRSNYGDAFQIFLSKVPVPENQIHPMFESGPPQLSADRYEKLLRLELSDDPSRLDLIFLGLGTDGHTASLFPQSPALDERNKWVACVKIPEEDFSRITLTLPFINQTRSVLFLVAGPEKKEILNQILIGREGYDGTPASQVRPLSGRVQWLVCNT